MKKKHRYLKKDDSKLYQYINKYILKVLVLMLLTLITMIALKSNSNFKLKFYQKVYEENISFAVINNTYQKIFGSPIPFKNLWNVTTPVFNETLKYKDKSLYKDGVKLSVSENYLVPTMETGLVIFVGEKEGYGKTAIIQQSNGIDVWYSNLDEINIKLYDYIEKGSLIGQVKSELYLVFIKDGEVLDYNKYI